MPDDRGRQRPMSARFPKEVDAALFEDREIGDVVDVTVRVEVTET
jgi:hypothetical protein